MNEWIAFSAIWRSKKKRFCLIFVTQRIRLVLSFFAESPIVWLYIIPDPSLFFFYKISRPPKPHNLYQVKEITKLCLSWPYVFLNFSEIAFCCGFCCRRSLETTSACTRSALIFTYLSLSLSLSFPFSHSSIWNKQTGGTNQTSPPSQIQLYLQRRRQRNLLVHIRIWAD